MDLNYLLFIIAILNLGSDLYNSYRYRDRLPKWIRILVASAFGVCGVSWFIANDVAGYFSAVVLMTYLITMKSYSRSRSKGNSIPKPATWLLITLNCIGFLVQVYHGATVDPIALIDLGALWTQLFGPSEWWRLLTAQFLHIGILHLACNMLGLSFVGPIVEHAIGKWLYLLGYFVSGTGGMLIAISMYSVQSHHSEVILVGASANVLGLVGIAAAISLRRYKKNGSEIARTQLSTMAQIVFLQIIFDALIPEVSSRAHLGGAAVGFLYGLLVSLIPSPVKTRRSEVW